MKKALVTVDFKGNGQKVLTAAKNWAKAFDGKIILLNVDHIELDNRSLEIEPVMAHHADDIKHLILLRLKAIEDELNEAAIPFRHVLKSGTPHEKILEVAEDENIDVIFMGLNKHSAAYRFLIGSVADQVIKKSKIPMMLIPNE